MAFIAALPGSGGHAQSFPGLEPGARVRVVAEGLAPRPLVGTFLALDGDSMELRLADRGQLTRVPREAIRKVEVSHGRHSRGRFAAIGALVGLAVGATAVLVTPECKGDCWDTVSKGQGAAIVGAMGAGLGAVIGLAIPPSEDWEVVATPQLSFRPGREGHVRVSLSIAF